MAPSLRNDLAIKMAELFSGTEPGGIIVLEVSDINYSLTQISQIVEGNDAKILSLYIHKPSRPFPGNWILLLKINKVDLSGILQTFARYDYEIKATYMDESQIKDFYDDRYDLFMKYINL